MAERLSDGTISWIGGMDTSRDPADLAEIQYSKAANVIIPNSLGGIKTRFGFHCAILKYENKATKEIYRKGNIQAEGSFESNGRIYIILLVSGFVLKFTKSGYRTYLVECLNPNDRNDEYLTDGWVITIPNGCIVNNGVDYPIIITETTQQRSEPLKGEIGIGRMGVYAQHRLFYVDQSGRRLLASDFMQPTMFTREGTNIFGFMCPDEDEIITAVGRQKTILNYAEGGNLIWSSNKDIYSADVRGTRSQWVDFSTSVGKTTETIPGFSAASSHSFEPFNSNIYFRNRHYGMVDVKQSEYQFVNLDTLSNQSIDASYFFDNDTDWMLYKCHSKACNGRLYTTVAPEINDSGHIYWNGMLSFHPAASYINQGTNPRRYESVFTGIRPWGITIVRHSNKRDEMIVHSHDVDGINRMYIMDENTDYDTNHAGERVEIEGFIELRAFNFQNPYLQKNLEKRFYRLSEIQRTSNIKVLSRTESSGEWTLMWDADHLVCRTEINDGVFNPINSKPQSRTHVMLPEERRPKCNNRTQCISIQYRFEFKGPITLHSFISIASLASYETVTTKQETECRTLIYNYLPDFGYSIQNKP